MRVATALALLALAAPPALAQTPVPTAAPPPPPAAPPPPASALTLAVEPAFRADGTSYVLRGDPIRVRGTLSPPVAGERVVVRFFRNGRKLRAKGLAVGPDGGFRTSWRSGARGPVTVRAEHRASPALGAVKAVPQRVTVVASSLGPGARGPLVRRLQRNLDGMRYAASRSGVFDPATQRAVMAYRKVNGMARRFDASKSAVRRVLRGAGAYRVRHPEAGHHVEADLSRQVLALVDGNRLVRAYHTSSGAPATPTVIGSFRVYMKTRGTNASGMVHSSYFIRGYAIHGYVSVPAFNASHGCLRVPIPDAWRIYSWIRMGDSVVVDP